MVVRDKAVKLLNVTNMNFRQDLSGFKRFFCYINDSKKVKLAEDLLSMPPSAKLVLKTLEYEGALSQKELSARTMLPERTVRLSLVTFLLEDL